MVAGLNVDPSADVELGLPRPKAGIVLDAIIGAHNEPGQSPELIVCACHDERFPNEARGFADLVSGFQPVLLHRSGPRQS
jgi:hypothetical protein